MGFNNMDAVELIRSIYTNISGEEVKARVKHQLGRFVLFLSMIKYLHYGKKKFLAILTLLSFEIIVLVMVFSGALLAFIQIANMVFRERKEDFDQDAFRFLAKYVSSINTNVMEAFSFLGDSYFLIPANIILISYFLFIRKHHWYSLRIPVIALSSLGLMLFLKFIFHRNRPLTPLLYPAKGYSFPSGHAMMSLTFYGLIIFIVWRYIKNKWLKWSLTVFLALLIIFIGTSRVYLRVHYASDVLAGFSVGLMWLLFSLWILHKIEKYSKKKVDPIVQSS